jgi:hypothetical protein
MSNELRYYTALHRISQYSLPDAIRRDYERGGGSALEASEEIDMSYENVIQEAKNAIRGRRRPTGMTIAQEVELSRRRWKEKMASKLSEPGQPVHNLANLRKP